MKCSGPFCSVMPLTPWRRTAPASPSGLKRTGKDIFKLLILLKYISEWALRAVLGSDADQCRLIEDPGLPKFSCTSYCHMSFSKRGPLSIRNQIFQKKLYAAYRRLLSLSGVLLVPNYRRLKSSQKRNWWSIGMFNFLCVFYSFPPTLKLFSSSVYHVPKIRNIFVLFLPGSKVIPPNRCTEIKAFILRQNQTHHFVILDPDPDWESSPLVTGSRSYHDNFYYFEEKNLISLFLLKTNYYNA